MRANDLMNLGRNLLWRYFQVGRMQDDVVLSKKWWHRFWVNPTFQVALM
jgi:hypothetical protein